MPPSLRTVVRRMALRPVAGLPGHPTTRHGPASPDSGPAAAARRTGGDGLDAVVRWVAVSELADPTPYLEGGELLLTTGLRMEGDQSPYVARLVARGVAGLGFGVGVSHEEIPPALVTAADEAGLPLFEVPRETPFIAIGKAVSELLAAEQYEEITRAFAAQGRLTRAALRPEGMHAVIDRLAKEVGGWAALLDECGEVRHATAGANTDAVLAELTHFRTGHRPEPTHVPEPSSPPEPGHPAPGQNHLPGPDQRAEWSRHLERGHHPGLGRPFENGLGRKPGPLDPDHPMEPGPTEYGVGDRQRTEHPVRDGTGGVTPPGPGGGGRDAGHVARMNGNATHPPGPTQSTGSAAQDAAASRDPGAAQDLGATHDAAANGDPGTARDPGTTQSPGAARDPSAGQEPGVAQGRLAPGDPAAPRDLGAGPRNLGAPRDLGAARDARAARAAGRLGGGGPFPASLALSAPGEHIVVQPLGGGVRPRGFFAVGAGEPFSPVTHTVINAAGSLLTLAMEQDRTHQEAGRRIRSAVLELLLTGAEEQGRAVLGRLGRRLPEEPLAVLAADAEALEALEPHAFAVLLDDQGDADHRAARDRTTAWGAEAARTSSEAAGDTLPAGRRTGSLSTGRAAGPVTIALVSDATAEATALEADGPVGVSLPCGYAPEALYGALDQALRALDAARNGWSPPAGPGFDTPTGTTSTAGTGPTGPGRGTASAAGRGGAGMAGRGTASAAGRGGTGAAERSGMRSAGRDGAGAGVRSGAGGRGRGNVVRFAELAGQGLLGLLDQAAVQTFAAALLAPLTAYGSKADLVESLRAYLDSNGHWDAAAQRLGVHRHTLRYRMRRVAELLNRDLDDPGVRAELWLALEATRR